MRILLIFGTRPEAIKMCPLAVELRRRREHETLVCVTGQHRALLDEILSHFDIHPDFDLDVMTPNQPLAQTASKMLAALPSVLAEAAPDLVLVHGDTASAFAAAVCCFYQKIPIGHVEAGLRTGCMSAPFPEEFHRRAIALCASYHFAPTKTAADHLLHEGIDPETVFLTGNTVVDALRSTLREDYTHRLLDGTPYLFLTAHRRENHGAPLRAVFSAAKALLDAHPELKLICPVHPSPEVLSAAHALLGSHPRAHLIKPLSLIDCHNLLARARLILTDSGGIQEEATALGLPALVLRDLTERPEGVLSGNLIPVGTDETSILTAAEALLSMPSPSPALSVTSSVYGDGTASKKIADLLCGLKL